MKPLPLLFLVCSLACQNLEKTPQGILPPTQFAQALIELSVIEAAQQQQALPPQYQKQPNVWTSHVLARLNTDTTEFNQSYRYYYTHPEKMKIVLAEMQKMMNQH